MAITVLIPALNPSESLLGVVDPLAADPRVAAILLVDDGSNGEHRSIFEEAARRGKVEVLRHAVNLGKGAALRTGINRFLCRPELDGVLVTADADGQHLPEDILAVGTRAEDFPGELVLGSRAFSGDVPLRSRIGNDLTRIVFRIVIGRDLPDTQTGLRAIPRSLMPRLLRIRAPGYDFELEMLIVAARVGIPTSSVTIRTVYLDGNRGSHFNPLLDSMRIYFVFARFLSSATATALIDCLVFSSVFPLAGSIPWAMAAGRLVAGTFNFMVNRHYVFHSQARLGPALLRYIGLVAALGLLSYIVVDYLASDRGWNTYLSKLFVEALLLAGSFLLQQHVVFAPRPLSATDDDAED